jgi:hypothetical protein
LTTAPDGESTFRVAVSSVSVVVDDAYTVRSEGPSSTFAAGSGDEV